MQSRARYFPLHIPSDVYKGLVELGRAQERDPYQQARWILKEAVRSTEPADTATDRELATANT